MRVRVCVHVLYVITAQAPSLLSLMLLPLPLFIPPFPSPSLPLPLPLPLPSPSPPPPLPLAVDLIAACDIRYCSADSWYQIKEVDIGLAADIGTLQRLPKIVGNHRWGGGRGM